MAEKILNENEDGVLQDPNLAGVGTLYDVIGADEANEFFDKLESRRAYLRRLAAETFGRPRYRPVSYLGHISTR